MALNSEILLNSLREPDFDFCGPRTAEIYETQLFVNEGECRPSVFYITDFDTLVPKDVRFCIMRVRKANVRKQLERAQALLTRDYRRKEVLSRLCHAISKGVSLDEISCVCHEVMENPVCLLDNQFRAIALSGAAEESPALPAYVRSRLHPDSKPTIIDPDNTTRYRRILGNILLDGVTTGFVLVYGSDRELEDLWDIEYVSLICIILSGHLRYAGNSNERDFTKEDLVLSLLQSRLTDPKIISEKMKELNLVESEKYYLVAIDRSNQDKEIPIRNELKRILNTDIYSYSHYYIAILGCAWDCQLHSNDFPELIKYLYQHNLSVGLSYGFFNISMLSIAFMQSTTSLKLRKRFTTKDIRFARYEDRVIAHLLKIAIDNGIPMISFCHPTVIRIYEYDKENNTDYLETLAAYILNNLSPQSAADVLFIHRNTMHNRLSKLKELFKIDFDNLRLITKLHLSILVYSYFGIGDYSSFQEPAYLPFTIYPPKA